MKSILSILLFVCLIGISSCGHKGKSNVNTIGLEAFAADTTVEKTTMRFLSKEHDFGQVHEGEKLVHVFELENTGKADLLLQSVRPSCGCTTPQYDKRPIRPGKKGSIEVVFNTKGRPGKQHKSVTVFTNTDPANTVLYFTCEVLPAKSR